LASVLRASGTKRSSSPEFAFIAPAVQIGSPAGRSTRHYMKEDDEEETYINPECSHAICS